MVPTRPHTLFHSLSSAICLTLCSSILLADPLCASGFSVAFHASESLAAVGSFTPVKNLFSMQALAPSLADAFREPPTAGLWKREGGLSSENPQNQRPFWDTLSAGQRGGALALLGVFGTIAYAHWTPPTAMLVGTALLILAVHSGGIPDSRIDAIQRETQLDKARLEIFLSRNLKQVLPGFTQDMVQVLQTIKLELLKEPEEAILDDVGLRLMDVLTLGEIEQTMLALRAALDAQIPKEPESLSADAMAAKILEPLHLSIGDTFPLSDTDGHNVRVTGAVWHGQGYVLGMRNDGLPVQYPTLVVAEFQERQTQRINGPARDSSGLDDSDLIKRFYENQRNYHRVPGLAHYARLLEKMRDTFIARNFAELQGWMHRVGNLSPLEADIILDRLRIDLSNETLEPIFVEERQEEPPTNNPDAVQTTAKPLPDQPADRKGRRKSAAEHRAANLQLKQQLREAVQTVRPQGGNRALFFATLKMSIRLEENSASLTRIKKASLSWIASHEALGQGLEPDDIHAILEVLPEVLAQPEQWQKPKKALKKKSYPYLTAKTTTDETQQPAPQLGIKERYQVRKDLQDLLHPLPAGDRRTVITRLADLTAPLLSPAQIEIFYMNGHGVTDPTQWTLLSSAVRMIGKEKNSHLPVLFIGTAKSSLATGLWLHLWHLLQNPHREVVTLSLGAVTLLSAGIALLRHFHYSPKHELQNRLVIAA